MSDVLVLKAKVDYFKTWTGVSIAATIAATIGYWANSTNQLASFGFAIMVFVFSFGAICFMVRYDEKYRKLIDELRKKKNYSYSRFTSKPNKTGLWL